MDYAPLESVLPVGDFTLLHVRSVAQKCRKLIFTSKSDKRLDALTTHYFVLISKDVAVLALELLAYESDNCFTLFVSKADTTGFNADFSTLRVTQALLRCVLDQYALVGKRVRILLFAKAEKQYLFLGSIHNRSKHVLPDAELVKWWTRCLDGLSDIGTNFKARVSIPGIDETPAAISKYFPPNARLPWLPGDLFGDGDELAVKCIPRFPDDPKSRFLDTIVADKRAKKVTKRQFWLELQSRQEFRLGKSVGIIGIEFDKENRGAAKRLPAMSAKDVNRFKDLLLSLTFNNLDETKHATERLLRGVDNAYKTALKGKAVERKRRAEPLQVVNTLGIRRKQKKTS